MLDLVFQRKIKRHGSIIVTESCSSLAADTKGLVVHQVNTLQKNKYNKYNIIVGYFWLWKQALVVIAS